MTHQHSHRDPACLEVFAKLSELLDGELTEVDCEHIESHIADCPPCIEFMNSLKRCVSATGEFRSTPECPPIPAEVEQKLRAAWEAALARRG
jgi:predicted anti-sigma-YlaC factor YlaD